jgi:hypothetical protein
LGELASFDLEATASSWSSPQEAVRCAVEQLGHELAGVRRSGESMLRVPRRRKASRKGTDVYARENPS